MEPVLEVQPLLILAEPILEVQPPVYSVGESRTGSATPASYTGGTYTGSATPVYNVGASSTGSATPVYNAGATSPQGTASSFPYTIGEVARVLLAGL